MVIEDICRRYDIDGLELDFWRHPPFFKSYAVSGKPVSTEERNQMTGLLLRIRTMTEQAGLDRGRPLLVAVRVPDSVGACLSLGFDIELWLKESLFDILIGGNGVQLTPWEETVALGHAHDVPVYPCIRPAIPSRRGVGSSAESYRALAMNIWRSGADGIYTFNMFKTRDRMFRELGDPEKRLPGSTRCTASTPVGFSMVKQHFNADPYLRLPILSPRNPSPLQAGRPTAVPLVVGDDLQGGASRGSPPGRQAPPAGGEKLASPRDLGVTINGDTLGRGSLAQGWLEYDVPPAIGENGREPHRGQPHGADWPKRRCSPTWSCGSAIRQQSKGRQAFLPGTNRIRANGFYESRDTNHDFPSPPPQEGRVIHSRRARAWGLSPPAATVPSGGRSIRPVRSATAGGRRWGNESNASLTLTPFTKIRMWPPSQMTSIRVHWPSGLSTSFLPRKPSTSFQSGSRPYQLMRLRFCRLNVSRFPPSFQMTSPVAVSRAVSLVSESGHGIAVLVVAGGPG